MEGSASQAGFYYQNHIAALKILESLFYQSDITYIVLENYTKGKHIDDVIVYREKITDYYQVKWSEDEENSYTLYNLLTAIAPKKSIFKQLTEGYQCVAAASNEFSIVLYSTRKVSKQKRPSEGLAHSLAELISDFIQPLKASSLFYKSLPKYSVYQQTVERIRVECGLEDRSFDDFLRKLDFQLGQSSFDEVKQAIRFRMIQLGLEDSLFEKLLDSVVNWSITGEKVTRQVVLQCLGILNRFEDKLSQYFKVVEEPFYISNAELNAQLEQAVAELSGGYVFLEGAPGVGKSTALTKFKEAHKEVAFAYYCFIPDGREYGAPRHQREIFLRSMCVAIENHFPEVQLPARYSDRFEQKLADYLVKLAEEKEKVIFIIDGLDHVHRDLAFGPDSMLHQIKGPLPDGIFFILSAQYAAVLSDEVRVYLQQDPRRHIRTHPFTQVQIVQFFKQKGIEIQGFENLLEQVSQGIPLYLHYIAELLANTTLREYEVVLNALPLLENGKINTYHAHLYQKIEDDELAKWVLAVLAYRKEYTTAENIKAILQLAGVSESLIAIEQKLRLVAHLLRPKDGRSYTIFHNSFREFIIAKTPFLKDRFNAALVAYYQQDPFSDESYRNYFQHLWEIGRYETLVQATTLQWIKEAWANYRTPEELQEHVDLAWNAAVKLLSLEEFIRIGLLKAQLDRIEWNLDNSRISFPIAFLKAGLLQNSMRSVWDGDFVHATSSFFLYYINSYHEKTGNLPPEDMLKQGFSKHFQTNKFEDLSSYLEAKLLVDRNPVSVFERINEVQWVNSRKDSSDEYQEEGEEDDADPGEEFDAEESQKISHDLQIRLINHLADHKQIDQLLALEKAFGGRSALSGDIRMALYRLLLAQDGPTARSLVEDLSKDAVSEEAYRKGILLSFDFLENQEIVHLFEPPTLSEPPLHESLISKEYPYGFQEDLYPLFDNLKLLWLYQPEKARSLGARIMALPQPARNIYQSIFSASLLWHRVRTESTVPEGEKIALLKSAIRDLVKERGRTFQKSNYGLFDYPRDDNVIAKGLYPLFGAIFQFAALILPAFALEELVAHFLKLDNENNVYSYFQTPVAIAESIQFKVTDEKADLVFRLLQHAERLARQESETSTLIDNLSLIAESYGTCGLPAEFERIYCEIFEISFGVSYRKDYQASAIVSALEAMHQMDPAGTPIRLAEVIEAQMQLADAGNARMLHIGLSDLIAFTAPIFPELAFALIEKEDHNLGREEAFAIVLEPLVEKAGTKELSLLYSIIKTLPRWEVSGENANEYLSLAGTILSRAYELGEENLALRILHDTSYNGNVELAKPTVLKPIADEVWLRNRPASELAILGPDFTKATSKSTSENERVDAHKIVRWQKNFDRDITSFKSMVKGEFERGVKQKRTDILRAEYRRLKPFVLSFIQGRDWAHVPGRTFQFLRIYLEWEMAICLQPAELPLTEVVWQEAQARLWEQVNYLFGTDELFGFIQNKWKDEQRTNSLRHAINEVRDWINAGVVTQPELRQWIDTVSLLHVEELIPILEDWVGGEVGLVAFLQIMERLARFRPAKVEEYLKAKGVSTLKYLLFPSRQKAGGTHVDVFQPLIASAPAIGKPFLLQTFQEAWGEYSDGLLWNIGKLVKYAPDFQEPGAAATYYKANLQYNQELAKGLLPLKVDYTCVREHQELLNFEEVAYKYLVGLLNYPVFKVRELTMQALVDRLLENPNDLCYLFRFAVQQGNFSLIEYLLIVIEALSIARPSSLLLFKSDLWALTRVQHYTILEKVKAILQRVELQNAGFLSESEKQQLEQINKGSALILTPPIVAVTETPLTIYSLYQRESFQLVQEAQSKGENIRSAVAVDIKYNQGFDNYNEDDESETHRKYNKNTNFDPVEIITPYQDAIQNSLNKQVHLAILRNSIKESGELKKWLRLYDPSRLLYRPRQKPSYINWLPEIGKEEFMSFSDFQTTMKTFVEREPDWVTLFEYGSQRSDESYDSTSKTCYFDIRAYLKSNEAPALPGSSSGPKLQPYKVKSNLYASELPDLTSSSTPFPLAGYQPLLEVSINKFRGEKDFALASLMNEAFAKLDIPYISLLDLLANEASELLEAFHWQSAYSSYRRTWKPTSEGFTLKIRRDKLKAFLLKNNMVLCFEAFLRRSATSLSHPESYMHWASKRGDFIAAASL